MIGTMTDVIHIHIYSYVHLFGYKYRKKPTLSA
jgi:hypothetical protein